jgi:hypothetical protein
VTAEILSAENSINLAERVAQRRRYYIVGTAVLVSVSVIILLGAIFSEQVIRPRQAITTVNGTEVSTRDFEQRVRLARWQTAEQIRFMYVNLDFLQQIYGEQITEQLNQQINTLQQPIILGGQVLDEMEEELAADVPESEAS